MFPAANSQQRLSASKSSIPSKKVPLKPGRSLVDWIHLSKSGRDLKGTGPRLLRVSSEELAKHNKPGDTWLALRGIVYNVTEYMEYHPGGAEELMRGAGKDATSLFEQVHRWVNFESMLKECLIGKLVDSAVQKKPSTSMLAPPPPSLTSLNPLGINTMNIDAVDGKNLTVPRIQLQDYTDSSNILLPKFSQKITVPEPVPSYDWYQTKKNIVFILYTKCTNLKMHQIICDIVGRNEIFIDLILTDTLHAFTVLLHDTVLSSIGIDITSSGKAQITFTKSDTDVHWSNIGSIKRSQTQLSNREIKTMRFCNCTIVSKDSITHDTSLYRIKLPPSRWMHVPMGYHVYLRREMEDIEIYRPYTPVLASLIHENADDGHGCDLFLMIKHYEDGALTSGLKTLCPGDELSVSAYDGDFDRKKAFAFKTYVMLAAGTGITPMLRVLYSLMHDHCDCRLHLLFFNKKERDIIERDELTILTQSFLGRFFFTSILSQADDTWGGKRGRISKQLLQEYFRENLQNTEVGNMFFFICGPTQFTQLGKFIIAELGGQNLHAFT